MPECPSWPGGSTPPPQAGYTTALVPLGVRFATSLDIREESIYGLLDVYALFGIDYDTRRTRHLNVGLSPRMPDGGYQLFITLDKDTLAPDYDYEDILFQDQLNRVTQRGADQDDEDYVALRDPATRLSLFVRGQARTRSRILGKSAQQATSSSPPRAALNSVTTGASGAGP